MIFVPLEKCLAFCNGLLDMNDDNRQVGYIHKGRHLHMYRCDALVRMIDVNKYKVNCLLSIMIMYYVQIMVVTII